MSDGRLGFVMALFLLLSCPSGVAQEAKPFPPEQIKRGSDLYKTHCEACHGVRMVGPPWATDLNKFPRDRPARFVDAVTYGMRGMPPWGDLLKPDDIEALWAYVAAGERR